MMAASHKEANYTSLAKSYIFQPFAVESHGAFSSFALSFLATFGKRFTGIPPATCARCHIYSKDSRSLYTVERFDSVFRRWRTGPLAIPTFDFSFMFLALGIFTTDGVKIKIKMTLLVSVIIHGCKLIDSRIKTTDSGVMLNEPSECMTRSRQAWPSARHTTVQASRFARPVKLSLLQRHCAYTVVLCTHRSSPVCQNIEMEQRGRLFTSRHASLHTSAAVSFLEFRRHYSTSSV